MYKKNILLFIIIGGLFVRWILSGGLLSCSRFWSYFILNLWKEKKSLHTDGQNKQLSLTSNHRNEKRAEHLLFEIQVLFRTGTTIYQWDPYLSFLDNVISNRYRDINKNLHRFTSTKTDHTLSQTWMKK